MTFCDGDCFIGDLVCLKSLQGGRSGWIGVDIEPGIVLEVIEVEKTFVFYDKKFRCYDYVIYWIETGVTETVPDILIEKYEKWIRRLRER